MQDFFILIYKHKFIHDQIIEVFPSKDSVKNYLILKYVDDDSVFNKIDYLIASGESFAHNYQGLYYIVRVHAVEGQKKFKSNHTVYILNETERNYKSAVVFSDETTCNTYLKDKFPDSKPFIDYEIKHMKLY